MTRGHNQQCLLLSDDKAIIQEKEDNLQKGHGTFEGNRRGIYRAISIKKTKIMASQGKDPIRTEIVASGKTLDQIYHFDYQGSEMSLVGNNEAGVELGKFRYICLTTDGTQK